MDRQSPDSEYTSEQLGNRKDKKESIRKGFIWPSIGWEVVLVYGFESLPEPTYIDNHIPSPLNAYVKAACTHCE